MSDSFDDWQDEWMKAFREAGHEPVLEPTDEWGDLGEERVDYFYTSGGHHNGPGCRKCGWSCCMHCVPAKRIPLCPRNVVTHIDVWFDLDQTRVWWITPYNAAGDQVGDSANYAHKKDAKTHAEDMRIEYAAGYGNAPTLSIGKRDGSY